MHRSYKPLATLNVAQKLRVDSPHKGPDMWKVFPCRGVFINIPDKLCDRIPHYSWRIAAHYLFVPFLWFFSKIFLKCPLKNHGIICGWQCDRMWSYPALPLAHCGTLSICTILWFFSKIFLKCPLKNHGIICGWQCDRVWSYPALPLAHCGTLSICTILRFFSKIYLKYPLKDHGIICGWQLYLQWKKI